MQKKGSAKLLSAVSIAVFILGLVLLVSYFLPVFSFTGFAVYDPDAFNLTFVDPTPSSGTSQTSTSVTINISSDASLAYAWIDWNGTNESMTGSGTNWYITKTDNGLITYTAYGNGSDGNYSSTGERTITLGADVINITLPNTTIDEDSSFADVDIWNYTASSHLDSELNYTILSETATSVIDCAILSDRYLNCTLVANASGSSTISVEASYASSSSTSNMFINVTPVNDPPYLSTKIPNQTFNNNETITIDLDDYFADIESGSLNYSTTNPNNITFSFNIASEDANLSADDGFEGIINFTFIANDSQNWTHSNMIFLNVSSNVPASSSSSSTSSTTETTVVEESFAVPNQEWMKNEVKILNIADHLTTIPESPSYTVEGLSNIQASFEGSTLTLTPVENWYGIESATFRVTGTDKVYVSEATTLTVKNQNRAPTLKAELPTIKFTENQTEILVDFNEYFTDPDGDELEYGVGEAISVNVTMKTKTVAVFALADTPAEIANETIQISAKDPAGESLSDELLVTIEESLLKQPIPWMWVLIGFVLALGLTGTLFVLKRRGQLHLPHLHLPKFRFRKPHEKPKEIAEETAEELQEVKEVPEQRIRIKSAPLGGGLSKLLKTLFPPKVQRYQGSFRQEALYIRESIAIMHAVMSASEDRLARSALFKEKEKLAKAYNVLRQGLADTNIRKELLYLKEIKASVIEIRSISTDRLVREELSKIIELVNKVLKSFYQEQENMANVMRHSKRSRPSSSPRRSRKRRK